ncbi:MAG: 23S rRNA (guanosine(2251)-2'-O)-methyltransferase RlmB [Anaerolineales bacterium]
MSTDRLYGRNPIYEALRAGRRSFHELIVAEGTQETGRLGDILAMASAGQVPIHRVPRTHLKAGSGHNQGVEAEVSTYPYTSLDAIMARADGLDEPPLVLLLDVLKDPQNLGTLLRTAEAVGVHGVVLPPRRSASVSPAVVSASSGACEHMLIAQTNLAQAIEQLKGSGAWISGLESGEGATPLGQADLTGGMGLVVGSESDGMRRLVRESCDFLVRIPMRGRVDSLNAATAGSIVLYAVWAARGYPGIDGTSDS